MTHTDHANRYGVVTLDEPVKPKKGKLLVGLIVLVLLGAIGIVGGVLVFGNSSAKDSGVTACETMKKNAEDGKKSSSNSKMTEAQRKEKREPFENSKYADIRVAGTNLVDSLYEMDQKEDTDLGGALVMLTTIRTQYAALQTACSAHGVNLPNLPSA